MSCNCPPRKVQQRSTAPGGRTACVASTTVRPRTACSRSAKNAASAAASARRTATSQFHRPRYPARRASRARTPPGGRRPARAPARRRRPADRQSADWCAGCRETPARPATATRCADASPPAHRRGHRRRHSAPGRPADPPGAAADAAAWTCPRHSLPGWRPVHPARPAVARCAAAAPASRRPAPDRRTTHRPVPARRASAAG